MKETDFVLLVTEPTPFGLNDLKLAVAMTRELKLHFSVVINRSDLGDRQVQEYCHQENINIVMELPDDRRIAEAYSSGQMIVDALPKYRKYFVNLEESIKVVK